MMYNVTVQHMFFERQESKFIYDASLSANFENQQSVSAKLK